MIQKCNGVKISELDSRKNFTGSEYVVVADNEENYKIPIEQISDVVVDSSKFKAVVENVYTSSKPVADVTLDKGTFKFTFGIPPGEKGKDGTDGKNGKDGTDGKDGIPGVDGIDGDTTRTVVAYKSTKTSVKPDLPIGGSWDYATNTVTYPEGWSGNDNNPNGYLWQSTAVFSSNGTMVRTWDGPFRLTGDKGADGADGTNIQFVYKRTITSLVRPVPDHPTGSQEEAVEQGWTDHPTGINEEYQCEWVSSRVKSLNTGEWYEWEPCVIWAKWGSVGKDGDGVEYIFQRTKLPAPPKDITDNNPDVDEYIPSSAAGEEPWTDDPSGVNETFKCEWVSQRKYKGSTRKWGNFSSPAQWANYSQGGDGQDGYSLRVMYTKTADSSTKPIDPIRLNINPGSVWSVGMPEITGKQALWGIQALVSFDNQLYIDTSLPENERGWQGPYLISGVPGLDGNNFNYQVDAYKQSSSEPAKPTNNDPYNPGNGWVTTPTSSSGTWWKCTALVQGETATVISWSSVIKVTGTSINIKGTLSSVDDLPSSGNNIGDGYIIDGILWTWNGSEWVNTGKIQGPAGKDGDGYEYIYTRTTTNTAPSTPSTSQEDDYVPTGWTDDPSGVSEQYPYEWVSTRKREDSVWSVFSPPALWARWSKDGAAGANGNYVEYRFARNNSWDTAPTLATTTRIPSGWSTSAPVLSSGKVLWATYATISGLDNTLVTNWATPYYMTGVTGNTGASGTPGVGYEVRYCKGTQTTYVATYNDTVKTTRNPSSYGWSLTVPELTSGDSYNYIWFIQSRILNDELDLNSGSGWSKPNPMGGIITPNPQTESPVMYPQGIYKTSTSYVNDGKTTPYVYDTQDGNFYVLQEVMTWLGTNQNNVSPAIDTSGAWLKMEHFESVFADTAIIANSLIGGAVFNNNLMFSQRGKNSSNADSQSYNLINTSDPMNTSNSFRPNFLLDFAKGEAYFGAGGIHLAADNNSSSIALTNTNSKMTLNKDGIDIQRLTSGGGTITTAPIIARINSSGFMSSSYDSTNSKTTTIQANDSGVTIKTNKVGTISIGQKNEWNHLTCNVDGSGSLADGNIYWDTNGVLYAPIIYETIDVSTSSSGITLPDIQVGCSKSYIVTTPAYTRLYNGHLLVGTFETLTLYTRAVTYDGTPTANSYVSGSRVILKSNTVYCITGSRPSSEFGTTWKIIPLADLDPSSSA